MKRSSYINRGGGFTLLDVLVALIIFSLASIFIVTMTANAIDKPKQVGVLSDFENYELVGVTVLKELGNTLSKEDTLDEFNSHLNRDIALQAGVSKKKSPYSEPYVGEVLKDTTQISIVITTKGRKKDDLFRLVIIREGTTVETCSRGFGKNDKNLVSLESGLCDTATVDPPVETEEPELPSFTPITEVPAGCTGIYTALDMYNIRNNLKGCYILMNPIDLSSYPNWIPIGGDRSTLRFRGTLDGQMYPITNLKITRNSTNSDDNGLFGRVEGASFKNIAIVSPEITANSYTGALFGEGETVSVQDSYVLGGSIKGVKDNAVGGLIGRLSSGTINNSYANTDVTGNSKVGVLVGTLTNTTVTESRASGKSTSTLDTTIATGGLIGEGYNVTIESAYSDAVVTAIYGEVGGIIGYAYNVKVKNSNNKGDILGYGYSVGGLVGWGERNLTVENSYSTGRVVGGVYVGGLIGHLYFDGTVDDSYSTGDVWGYNKVGGLVGETNGGGFIRNSHSSSKVTGASTVGGLVGNLHDVSVLDSYATGDVTLFMQPWDITNAAGGLIGQAYGVDTYLYTIERSYATGSITGETNSNVGGFAGELDTVMVKDSYATGRIDTYYITTDEKYPVFETGGFAGNAFKAKVQNVYATGKVKGSGVTKGHIGAEKYSTSTGNSYYDRQTTGKTGDGVIMKSKTTSQMKQKATYVGWDFETVWRIEEGQTYPTLR